MRALDLNSTGRSNRATACAAIHLLTEQDAAPDGSPRLCNERAQFMPNACEETDRFCRRIPMPPELLTPTALY